MTHRLVESYRNTQGKVRQQVLLNLGRQFDFPKEHWKLIADRIEDIRQGQISLITLEAHLEKEAQRIAKLLIQKFSHPLPTHDSKPNQKASSRDYQYVDVNSIEHQYIRKIGAEYVGYHAAQQLKLDPILREAGFNSKQVNIAMGSIIGRFVHPGSELNLHYYLTEQSALDELLGTDFSNLPLKSLYQISDLLWKNKFLIEQQLFQREKDLFHLEEIITLFDITNTYFEGRCLLHPKARYGRSKEKRNDCPLVALAMVLDVSGFVKKSEIFPGNISEPQTLEQMLKIAKDDKKTLIVMDAGIASEKNIKWLKEFGYQYVVVSRRKNPMMFENQGTVIVKENNQNRVEVVLVKNEKKNELELYCHSSAKEAKTKSLVSQTCLRYETSLKNLAEGLHKKRGVRDYQKIIERLGRLKEKYKRVTYLYEVAVQADDQNKQVINITWQQNREAVNDKQRGIYCLRTNNYDLDEKTFWHIYTMLTDLEAAFRSLKSELGFRPVYHQKENRIDGHLFISILAYHLLHTIRYQLKAQGIHESWNTLREILNTQCRITTTLKLQNGRSVKIRKTNSPDPNQQIIYQALGISAHPGQAEKAYF